MNATAHEQSSAETVRMFRTPCIGSGSTKPHFYLAYEPPKEGKIYRCPECTEEMNRKTKTLDDIFISITKSR